eukprot:2744106-Alexandrium_andersonii.AAC.1
MSADNFGVATTEVNLEKDMGAWPLGKEGGWATKVGNDPGGESRVPAQGPDAEANRLGGGGRRSVGHAGEHGRPETAKANGNGSCPSSYPTSVLLRRARARSSLPGPPSGAKGRTVALQVPTASWPRALPP